MCHFCFTPGITPAQIAESSCQEKDFEHIFNDIQTDANFKPVAFGNAGTGQVHTGFKNAFDAVWPRLISSWSCTITGP